MASFDDLTEDELAAIAKALRQTIDNDRYPLSPRLRPFKNALAKPIPAAETRLASRRNPSVDIDDVLRTRAGSTAEDESSRAEKGDRPNFSDSLDGDRRPGGLSGGRSRSLEFPLCSKLSWQEARVFWRERRQLHRHIDRMIDVNEE